MKKTILFITSLVLIVGIAKSQTVNIDDLIINQEDGLYYKEGSDNPLSGKVVYTEGGGSTTRFTSEGMTVTKNPIIVKKSNIKTKLSTKGNNSSYKSIALLKSSGASAYG